MINLLPQNEKAEIRAGYNNLLLIRYTLLTGIATLLLIVALIATYIVLIQASDLADETKQTNDSQVEGFASIQNQANELRDGLNSAKTTLDSEINYSKVMINLAQILPEGTAINTLSLDDEIFSKPLMMDIQVKDKQAAEKLKNSLENSPFISQLYLGSISTSQDGSGYSYIVDVTLTLNKDISL